MIRATIDGLQSQTSPRMVAQRRGKKVSDILPKTARNAGRGSSMRSTRSPSISSSVACLSTRSPKRV